MKIKSVYLNVIFLFLHLIPLMILEGTFYFCYISNIEKKSYISNLISVVDYSVDLLPINTTVFKQFQQKLSNTTFINEINQNKIYSDLIMNKENNLTRANFYNMLNIICCSFVVWVMSIPYITNDKSLLSKVKWIRSLVNIFILTRIIDVII